MGDDRDKEQLWAAVYGRLVGWTVNKKRLEPKEADEVVREAITQFVAANNNHGDLGERDLLRGVGSCINGNLRNRRRKKIEKATSLSTDGVLPEQNDHGLVEADLITADLARRAVSALLDRVTEAEADDDLLPRMVLAMIDGHVKPRELATHLGVGIGDVYNARKRLARHVAAVKSEMGDL